MSIKIFVSPSFNLSESNAYFVSASCNKECWDACSVYTGALSVTVNNMACQAWSAKTPHNHTLDKDELFPYDGSSAAALNYCRDPRGDGQPGCFTVDPLVRYEFCDVPVCESKLNPIMIK